MRWLVLLALLIALPARADVDAPDDPDELDDGIARPRWVHAKLVGTTIELSARFAIDAADRGVLLGANQITVPAGALVTDAKATFNGKAHALHLVEADAAETAFEAITNKPPARDRTVAIKLAMRGGDTLAVDLASPRRGTFTLDLTLTMPACFYHDARYALVPETWYRRLESPQSIHIADNDDADRDGDGNGDGPSDDALNATCAPSGAMGDTRWIAFPARELTLKPPGPARIGAFGGRLSLGAKHLARVEIDLSNRLERAPDDLYTAIVIDRSRSVTTEAREAQRAIVASYVARAPAHSRIQVIGYARRAEAVLPAWMPAGAAAPRVDREIRALAPRNGSNIDDAIAEAGRWLERVNGTRRVIVFSDDLWADRLTQTPAESFAKLLPAGTLVHAVSLTGGPGLMRDDELPLGPLAKVTEGIAVTGGLDDAGHIDATMLVRPISLDMLTVHGAGWEMLEIDDSSCTHLANDFVTEEVLPEGESCVWWGTGKSVAGPITIEGFLWGKKLSRIVSPDPSQARSVARILSAHGRLDEELQALVDHAAFAVNGFWSMLGTWGGGGGYEDLGGLGSLSGGGSDCCSDGVTHGFGVGTGAAQPELQLYKQVAAAVRACNRGAAHATITIETTFEEIVDVEVETAADDALRACLAEAVWDATLAIAQAPVHATSRVVL